MEGSFECVITTNWTLVNILFFGSLSIFLFLNLILVVVFIKDFYADFTWKAFFKGIGLYILDIIIWFLEITGIMDQLKNYISLYNKLSPADVITFWKTLLMIVIWLALIALHYLWYVKAYFFEYWHLPFNLEVIGILVVGYFSFWMGSLYSYWYITDWFFKEGFMDAFNSETIYWFEANSVFLEG